MAVRRAAGAKWAARRAEEARTSGEEGESPGKAATEPGTPAESEARTPKSPGSAINRRPKKEKTPSSGQFDPMMYGGYPPPMSPYGMYPPYGMPFPPMSPYGAMMPPPPPMFPGAFPGAFPPPFMPPAMPPTTPHARTPGRKSTTKSTKSDVSSPGEGAGKKKKKGDAQTPGGASEDASPSIENSEEVNPNASPTAVPLLQEARKPSPSLQMSEVIPVAVDFAKDKFGSRFLATKLEEGMPAADKDKLFGALLDEVPSLINDQWGSKVVEGLFGCCNSAKKKELMTKLQPTLLQHAREPYGCRVIQTAIAEATRELQQLIADALKEDVTGCIESKHGNHVIQKCIEQMPPDFVDFIIKAIDDDTEKMASHSFGCRVVQRLLEHCKLQKLETMLDQILNCIDKLAKDPYGNYVVQHVLTYGRESDKKKIMEFVKADLVNLSMYRFSSSVVEKCFVLSTSGQSATELAQERAALMSTLLGEPGNTSAPIHKIMEDRFGNHVLMTVSKHTKPEEQEIMKAQLLEAQKANTISAPGKRILAQLNGKPAGGDAAAS